MGDSAADPAGGSGGLSGSLDHAKTRHALMLILTNPLMRESLINFSRAEHNEENVLLWVAIRNFKDSPAGDRDRAANAIVDLVRGV
jgi:hypothetical protein